MCEDTKYKYDLHLYLFLIEYELHKLCKQKVKKIFMMVLFHHKLNSFYYAD